jgi:hypothetical protein
VERIVSTFVQLFALAGETLPWNVETESEQAPCPRLGELASLNGKKLFLLCDAAQLCAEGHYANMTEVLTFSCAR